MWDSPISQIYDQKGNFGSLFFLPFPGIMCYTWTGNWKIVFQIYGVIHNSENKFFCPSRFILKDNSGSIFLLLNLSKKHKSGTMFFVPPDLSENIIPKLIIFASRLIRNCLILTINFYLLRFKNIWIRLIFRFPSL